MLIRAQVIILLGIVSNGAPNTTVEVNKEMVEGTQSIETFQKADKILSINVDNPNVIDVADVGGGSSD